MWKALLWLEFWRDFEPDDRPAPPHNALKSETGIGKSELLRQAAALQFIPTARREGLPHRVLIAVPTHKLADEARGKMPSGVTVAIWQGRGGTHLETGEPMCGNPEAVEAAQEIGADIEETACRSKTARCPLFDICHYQRQKEAARTADIVYCAHEILFQLPKALGKGFGLVVVDESFWQDGLTTKAKLVLDSLAEELATFPVRDYGTGQKLSYETMHLGELIRRLQQALNQMPDDYVTRQPLIDAGLLPATAHADSSCTTARKLEWQRKVDTKLGPDATPEQRKEAIKKFGFLARLPRRAAMWRALDDLIAGSDDATGRLRIESTATKDGPVHALRLLGRKEISAKLMDLPIIVADATLSMDIVRHYLPNLWLAADLRVDAPHQKVTQVIGLPVGKASLQALPPGKRRPCEEERVARKRQRLVDACRHLAQGQRGLIVTYQSIEADFASIENLETGHFNAIEGSDRWKAVDTLVTIGRPLPRSEDIQDMAAAVTGLPVIAGDMLAQQCRILEGPLTGQIIKRRIFGTPEAEMIRQAITEAAIEQAVGRARGVNRTATTPVEVYVVLDDTIVPGLPVNQMIDFGSVEPDAIDHMLACGLVPQWGADAHKLYPNLFLNAAAARKMFQRAQLDVARGTRLRGHGVTFPYKKVSIRRCHTVRVARYQPIGPRQQTRLVQIDLAKVPDPRAVLEQRLGPLAKFEVMKPPAPPPKPETWPAVLRDVPYLARTAAGLVLRWW